MPHIEVLDQNTINKIAAGEVIERPASVVKELMENAIDARATAVTVEIRDGGLSLIRVTDNGCGIPEGEVATAFLRHATSKIRTAEDLAAVGSLGFRGEALASIAAVSQVEVITKTPEQLTGLRYQIEGGAERGTEEVGAPDGTTFLVRNLFFNTPARRKFLKTAQTEGAHVASLVEKMAMSHPDISVRFIQNQQSRLHTSGNHNLKDIIYTVFGRDIAANLLPVEYESEILQIRGFAGKPVIARSNRNFENYFINGRYVRSGLVTKAIEEAYKPFMMQHKYPFVLLHLSIEPEYLDVNVHRAKMELRFRDGDWFFQMIVQAVSQALAKQELIPEVTLEQEEKSPAAPVVSAPEAPRAAQAKEPEKPEQKPEKSSPVRGPEPFEVSRRKMEEEPVYQSRPMYSAAAEKTEPAAGQLDLFEEKFLEPESRKRHRLIGQLFDTYWLVEFDDHLYLIDQHAAHEKVLYERTMKSLKTREFTSQLLNPPLILTVSAAEAALLERYRRRFEEIGFEMEPFGGREYAVRAVPDNLFSVATKDLFTELLDGLSDELLAGSPDILCSRAASMSCKAAVKGNHPMSFAEADHLMDELLKLDNPYACPHGRPTMISMSRRELERKFRRIV